MIFSHACSVKVSSLDSQIETLNLTSKGQGKTKKAAKKISAENMLSMIAGTNVVRGGLGVSVNRVLN